MAKQAKAKTTKGVRNDARKNGKAAKKNPGRTHSYGEKPSQLQLVLMGKGMYRSWPVLGNGGKNRPATFSRNDSDL